MFLRDTSKISEHKQNMMLKQILGGHQESFNTTVVPLPKKTLFDHSLHPLHHEKTSIDQILSLKKKRKKQAVVSIRSHLILYALTNDPDSTGEPPLTIATQRWAHPTQTSRRLPRHLQIPNLNPRSSPRPTNSHILAVTPNNQVTRKDRDSILELRTQIGASAELLGTRNTEDWVANDPICLI